MRRALNLRLPPPDAGNDLAAAEVAKLLAFLGKTSVVVPSAPAP